AQSGYPMRPIARPPDDWNLALLIEGYRRRAGVETFQKDAVAKQVVRFVKDGGFLGLMPDQAWDSSGVSGPFMGRMCST
ncbi:MAG TPA: lipid A biosynthesis acyltransferase, partial [Synergistaceae bacterium]|nr:lipid A biosynthesis acyltransferase [Synergistaceae bacterium]